MTDPVSPTRSPDPLAIGVGFDVSEPNASDLTSPTSWERTVDSVFAWLPYAALAVSAVLAQLGDRSPGDRGWLIAPIVVASVWTYLTFTRMGPPTMQGQFSLRIYFVGFVIIAGAMMLYAPVLVVYAIAGFFHASLLRPWPLAFVGLAATSMIVYSTIVYPNGGLVEWLIYAGLVAFQTIAVGFGLYAGQRLVEVAAQRRAEIEQLEATRIENEGLHDQLVAQAHEAGVLDERQRMAREIHDTIAQGLTGVITQLEAVRQSWGDEPSMRSHLDNAAVLARDSLTEARRSVEAIRPAPLEASRLPEALTSVAERWSAVTGIPVAVATTGTPHQLPPDVEVTLLRAAQESLANVDKHADASRAAITLSYMDGSVTLDTRDDGVGFDLLVPTGPEHFGLAAMEQRVGALGGEMHVESAPGNGTAVSVHVPILEARLP